MNKLFNAMLALIAIVSFASCNDYETYAEKKEDERKAIESYLKSTNAKIITEAEFRSRGCVTDTAKNEWVLLQKSSIYMQVVNDGTYHDADGKKKDLRMKSGDVMNILCRFLEVNLMSNDTILSNMGINFIDFPEKMTVSRYSDTFTGSFVDDGVYDYSIMYRTYGSTSVPSGWLVPLMYMNLGRPTCLEDELANIRIIVPHAYGTSQASSSVYPTLYEISYQAGI